MKKTLSPALVLEIELGAPISDVSDVDAATGHHYDRAVALVRLHTQPVGIVDLSLPAGGIDANEVEARVRSSLGEEIARHLAEDADGTPDTHHLPSCQARELAMLEHPPRVSVVVATRDRPGLLAQCLESLRDLDYPDYEVIVVDNVPTNDATRYLIEQEYARCMPVRYVREDQPGLAAARNRGVCTASGDIVAVTDDDVLVDRFWLARLAAGFERGERVACVTGMIFPRELDTEAQLLVENYWGLGKGFSRRLFDLRDRASTGPLFPYAAGVFGSGANFAFRTSVLRDMGGFDPALGAGTPARGGEDLAAFCRTLLDGYQLVYEPAAIVHHLHHRDRRALQRLAYGYGAGLTAYLTKLILDDPAALLDLLQRVPSGIAYWLRTSRRRGSAGELPRYPLRLQLLELFGLLSGPGLYVRSRRGLARCAA
jgi:glycosyltransferase involved in cell wall biosynthesis